MKTYLEFINEGKYDSFKMFDYFYELLIEFLEKHKDENTFPFFQNNYMMGGGYGIEVIDFPDILKDLNIKIPSYDDFNSGKIKEDFTGDGYKEYFNFLAKQLQIGFIPIQKNKAPKGSYNYFAKHVIVLNVNLIENFEPRKIEDILKLFKNERCKIYLSHEFNHFIDRIKILNNFTNKKKKDIDLKTDKKRKFPMQMGYSKMWKDYNNSTHEVKSYLNMILMNINKNDFNDFNDYYKIIIEKLKEYSPKWFEKLNKENLKLINKIIYDYYNYDQE